MVGYNRNHIEKVTERKPSGNRWFSIRKTMLILTFIALFLVIYKGL